MNQTELESGDVESAGPVWDLVAEFLERRERGESIDAETFARSHPEVAGRLRECLASFRWMEAARNEPGVGDEVLPRRFGNYDLLRVVGRGGMGCVYEARHRPLNRHVAVKVLPPHLTHLREFRVRFLREARVIASLHHTHIAPVFEVGQIGNTLYLAMPFIDGPNLRELVLPSEDGHRAMTRPMSPPLSSNSYFRWLADIGLQAADAIAHAHSRGVIHRDIKPSNLLLDAQGAVWIVDFGLAKAPAHPTVTQPGELIGTLRYASPEQVRGEQIDERTDVYSLGVTLYEVLTRSDAFPPGPGNQVLSTEPARPRRINPRIPRDLETIVMRAMAKRPHDRYRTAAALADDLRRFLRDEPIRARRIGPAGRFVRWCRRNPALSGVTTTSLVLLVALAVFDHFRLASERDAERRARGHAAERYADLLEVMARQSIDSAEPQRSERTLDMIRRAAEIRFRQELWELAIHAIDQLDATPGTELKNAHPDAQVVAIDAAGNTVVASLPGNRLQFWNTADGADWSATAFGEPIHAIEWSPTADRLAAVSSSHVWSLPVDRSARTVGMPRVICYRPAAVAMSWDGRKVALWGSTLSVWDLNQDLSLWERPAERSAFTDAPDDLYQTIAWSPDGQVIAGVPKNEPTVEFFSASDGRVLHTLHLEEIEADPTAGSGAEPQPPVASIAFSPDSRQLACAGVDGAIRILNRNPEDRLREPVLRGHERAVKWLAYSGDWLVSADSHEVRLWDLVRGIHPGLVVRSMHAIRDCSIDAAGRSLVLVDEFGRVGTWRLPSTKLHELIGPEPYGIVTVAASPDEQWLAWSDTQGKVTLRGPQGTRLEFESELASVRLVFSPGGNTLAIAGAGSPTIQLRGIATGTMAALESGESIVPGSGDAANACTALTFVNTERLVAAYASGKIVVWDLMARRPFATVNVPPVRTLAASDDGKWFAGGTEKGDIYLWNSSSMSHAKIVGAHQSGVNALVFHPEAHTLVSASADGELARWQVPNLSRDAVFQGPGGSVRSLAFCLNGSVLASCGGDGRVVLWAGSQRIGSLRGRLTPRFDVLASTSKGHRLIAAGGPRQSSDSRHGGIEVWDLETIRKSVIESGLPDWSTSGTPELVGRN